VEEFNMAADEMYVWFPADDQDLKTRVSDFNHDLSIRLEYDYWPRMMGSSKFFIYDSVTGNFANVKYAGYMSAEKNGIQYSHIDMTVYRRISEDRTGPTFDGRQARPEAEKAAGTKFKAATSFSPTQAAQLESDFFSWYRKHFGQSNDFIKNRFEKSKFIWI
jgi:hypothetical protein